MRHKKYENNLNVISKNLKTIRKNKNISLNSLSDKLMLMGIDISKPSLYKLETGKRVLKDFELYGLAHVFNVPLEELLEDFVEELKQDEVI